MPETLPLSINVRELDSWRKAGENFALLDVREPWEVALCRIEGALEIPLGQIIERADTLPTDKKLVVFCHHGMRSLQAASWLRQHKVPDAINLDGGIDAWAKLIDPSVGMY